LIIVPDGATHFLPFHLLGLGGVPLAEHWTVSYLPSLDLLCREAAEPPARQGAEVFGLGYEGTWAQPGLPPLDGAPVEAAAVARVLGVAPVPEAQATPERVLAALSAARYVHLACHGDHDVVAAVLQRLRLTGGPLLTLDLLALDLRGLAVLGLSACETALGRVDQGGNPMGLVATALAGGVPCVVSALWPVADDTSTVFFVLLFDALAKGKAPREAFRHAQTETRLRYPAYRDWGAFSLSGAVLPL
jgi:CHAT domain-containing protein